MEVIREFDAAVAPFLTTWRTVEIRAIVDFETRSVLSMLAYFSPVDRSEVDVEEPVRGLSFVRAALPIARAEEMLGQWEQGRIHLDTLGLSVSNFTSGQFFDRFPPMEETIYRGLQLGSHRQLVLSFHGSQHVDEILSSKDPHMLAIALGFRSFEELSLQRVQFRAGSGYATRVVFFAPIIATITAETDGAKLRFTLTVHESIQTNDLRLSYRIQNHQGERLGQGDIAMHELERRPRRYSAILESTLPLADTSSSGELRLYHRRYKSQTEPLVMTGFVVAPRAVSVNLGADSLGGRLRQLREELVIGQAELAREAGLAQSDVWMIEHDRRRPRPATVRKLAEALSHLGSRQVHPSEIASQVARVAPEQNPFQMDL